MNERIPRKSGQPAKSDKHSDLYTDEDPKGTITGLKFASKEDADKSVSKIKSSGRSHAHKIQAAIAMEQRAKVMGKVSAAAEYRKFINSMKKKTKEMSEESSVSDLEKNLKNPHSYSAIDNMMQSIANKHKITPKELHDRFKEKHGKVPDDWAKESMSEEVPTNNVGGGAIAGVGVGPQGEPGISKKRKLSSLIGFIKRTQK